MSFKLQNTKDCLICMTPDIDDPMVSPKCGHICCKDCWSSWLSENAKRPSCPECDLSCSFDQLQPVHSLKLTPGPAPGSGPSSSSAMTSLSNPPSATKTNSSPSLQNLLHARTPSLTKSSSNNNINYNSHTGRKSIATLCGVCEKVPATIECLDCKMFICTTNGCNRELHEPKSKRHHTRRPINGVVGGLMGNNNDSNNFNKLNGSKNVSSQSQYNSKLNNNGKPKPNANTNGFMDDDDNDDNDDEAEGSDDDDDDDDEDENLNANPVDPSKRCYQCAELVAVLYCLECEQGFCDGPPGEQGDSKTSCAKKVHKPSAYKGHTFISVDEAIAQGKIKPKHPIKPKR